MKIILLPLLFSVCLSVQLQGPYSGQPNLKHPQDPSCVWYTLYEDLPEGTAEVIPYSAPEASAYLVLGLNGDGKTYPEVGSTVTVQYTLYLPDCTLIESSRDGDTAFSFNIGVGQVIQGWDVGVMEMSLGQRSALILSSDMAYGENGAGDGVIPPNTALIFDVEILKID